MSDRKRIILQPEYLKDFVCIGSACEDSCCTGWRVEIDRKTYKKYKKINHPELKPIIDKNITRKRNNNSDASYANIKMDSCGKCPFLDENNLCKVYIHAGKESLSETCTHYPRIVKQVNVGLERSATASCPEMVRLALLNPDGIAFQQVEQDISERIRVQDILNIENPEYTNTSQQYFWEIRMFSISLLQNRKYELSQRLAILGIIYKEIEKLEMENRTQDIPATLNIASNMIEDRMFDKQLNQIPDDNRIQIQIAKALAEGRLKAGERSQRYLECIKETLEGINYILQQDDTPILEQYSKNYKENFTPFITEKEYILENYLANEYFKEQMPFGSFKSIWDSYIFLCVLYGTLKFHLIGMSGYHNRLTDELVVKLIQSFSKAVMHNNGFIQLIIEMLKRNSYDSLAHMFMLTKN